MVFNSKKNNLAMIQILKIDEENFNNSILVSQH